MLMIISIFLWGLLIIVFTWFYLKIKDRLDIKDLLKPIEPPNENLHKEIIKLKEDITNLKGRINEIQFFNNEGLGGIEKGNEELGNGNLIMAEFCFIKEIMKKGEQPNAWVGLAHVYSALKRYEEALDAIQMAIKLDQNAPLFNREGQISIIHAEILVKLRRCKEAVSILEKEVLKINPEFRKAQRLLKECKGKIEDKRQS